MADTAVRRVGLLGGTYDPPHLGHLVVAETARVELGLDEVRLLVAGDPWMKEGHSEASHRVAMARLAVLDDPYLVVDDRETRRDGPTYTADTLEELRSEEPDVDWTFILGADAAAKLPRWRRAADAVALASFVVVTRPGHRVERSGELLSSLTELDVPQIDISSTELRRRVREGGALRYLVPAPVLAYIDEHDLYRS